MHKIQFCSYLKGLLFPRKHLRTESTLLSKIKFLLNFQRQWKKCSINNPRTSHWWVIEKAKSLKITCETTSLFFSTVEGLGSSLLQCHLGMGVLLQIILLLHYYYLFIVDQEKLKMNKCSLYQECEANLFPWLKSALNRDLKKRKINKKKKKKPSKAKKQTNGET